MIYTPQNWYWKVAGSTTQVWSSFRAQYVPVADSTYAAWVAAGNVATSIASANELFDVLVQQWMPIIFTSGAVITSPATPTLNGTYSLSSDAQNRIAQIATGIAAGKPLPGGGTTFNFADQSNAMHAFSSANFLNFAASVEGYVYAFEQALATLLGGGTATLPSNALMIA